jgi:hypothetical protein
MSIIPGTQETKIRRIMFQGQPYQKLSNKRERILPNSFYDARLQSSQKQTRRHPKQRTLGQSP